MLRKSLSWVKRNREQTGANNKQTKRSPLSLRKVNHHLLSKSTYDGYNTSDCFWNSNNQLPDLSYKQPSRRMLPNEEKVDLRILRTRHLLVQAMVELLNEKDLQSVTVSDIAERAMINRATFYAHFMDKYDLFAYIVRDFFQQVLNAEVSDTADFNRDNLEKLTLSVINGVSQLHSKCRPGPRDQIQPMIETEVQKQLYEFVLGWIENDGYASTAGASEITASVVSWTLFGAAMQHNQDFSNAPADDLAAQVTTLLVDGLEGIPLPA